MNLWPLKPHAHEWAVRGSPRIAAGKSLSVSTRPPSPLQVLHLLRQRCPSGGAKNDRVPNALEGKNHGTSQIERIAGVFWVDKRIDAVDTTRSPSDENRDGEDERSTEVRKLDRVEVTQLANESIPRAPHPRKWHLSW